MEAKALVILQRRLTMTTSLSCKSVGQRHDIGSGADPGEGVKANKIGWLFSVVLSEYRLATNSQLPPPQPLLFTRTVSHLPAPSSRASLAWVDESPLDERENEAKCRIGASRSRYWRPSRHPAVPLAATHSYPA